MKPNNSISSILIVDDQVKNLNLLSELLSDAGFDVVQANTGLEALNILKSNLPDLVLLDIILPDITGYEICKIIKSDDKTKDIPVLFISALHEIDEIVKGFEIGGADFIIKPIKSQEVLARVKTHLQLKLLRENLENKTIELQAANENLQNEIIERKKIADALQRSQILLNETGRMAKVGGWEFDTLTEQLRWTNEVYNIYEVDFSFFPSKDNLLDFYPTDSRNKIFKAFKHAVENGESFNLELELITAKGNLRNVHCIGKANYYENKIISISGTFQDITDRKQIEKSLLDSEFRYRILFEQAAVGVAQIDPLSGRFLKINKKYAEIIGYDTKEVLELTFQEISYPDDLKNDIINIEKLLKNEIKSFSLEKRYIRKDKHIIWVNLTSSLVKEGQNIQDYLLGIIEDISARKEIENILEMRSTQLKIANEQLIEEIEERKRNEDNLLKSKIILDYISGGVITIDENLIITSFNKSAQEITGFSIEESINSIYSKVFHLSDQYLLTKDSLNTRINVQNKSSHLIRKNGETIPIILSASILKGNSEFEKEYVIIFRDMSQLEVLQKELKKEFTVYDMISRSPKMQKIFSLLPAVASSNSSVLIEGSTGTGKELLARAIHNLSNRKDKPYIVINCGGIPSNLIESELFGHVKGAFTDAKYDRDGKIFSAEGGTLFLDEIAELPIDLQSKLLRLLENYEIQRVGLDKLIKVDIRIIAATNQDLKTMIKEKKFREDLYHRLNTIKFYLPPLKERKEDIPYLIEHFINKNNAKFSRSITNIAPNAMKTLLNYSFPGNIRELERAIEYSFIICDESIIDLKHLPEDILNEKRETEDPAEFLSNRNAHPENNYDLITNYRGRSNKAQIEHGNKPLEFLDEEEEKELIIATLQKFRGNKSRTSKALQIHYTTLWKKLKKYNIPL